MSETCPRTLRLGCIRKERSRPVQAVNGSRMILHRAENVLRLEAQTIYAQRRSLDKNFLKAVGLIRDCTGRVVVLGMGKSGLIGRKIAATLASTGTPAIFVHPSEGLHGDLGMIMTRDVVLTLSYSGETEELKQILPSLRAMGVPLIAL